MEKVYIVFYTCGSSRAVHVDVVPDLSTETLIRSFKRFICRRGIPKLIVLDNTQTVKTAAKFLSSLFELPEVQSFLLDHKIEWRSNLKLAPWWGGFFEHMIRCVKSCLKNLVFKRILPSPTLDSILPDRHLLRVAIKRRVVWRKYTSYSTLVEVVEPFMLMLYQTWARKHWSEALNVSFVDEVYQSWLY